MKLTKYKPHSILDSFAYGLPSSFFGGLDMDNETSPARTPRTNIVETDNAYELTMEMPGLEKADVDVFVDGDTLVVKGQRSESEETENKGFLRREFVTSTFERSFTLGKKIDREAIAAKMDHGVLKVTLPRSEQLPGRKVDIA